MAATHPDREPARDGHPRPDLPVEVGSTTAREHITGLPALNIPGVWRISGDWHQYSAWFSSTRDQVRHYHLTNDAVYGRLLDRLGRSGLRDGRPGLRLLNHPASHQAGKVWAAAHDRAVVEMAWARLQSHVSRNIKPTEPPLYREDLDRLLPFPDQWVRVHWWAWRLRAVMNSVELDAWDTWRQEWRR